MTLESAARLFLFVVDEVWPRLWPFLVIMGLGLVVALLVWPFLVFWFPNLAN